MHGSTGDCRCSRLYWQRNAGDTTDIAGIISPGFADKGPMTALTIGMTTYNDFDGVYFTIQSLRLYHDLADTEIVVIDNYGCSATRGFVERIGGRYILATDVVGTCVPRNLLFEAATSEVVLCCDSHILFWPDAIAKLKAYYREHPDSHDFLQGPIVADSLTGIRTHLEQVWNNQRLGVWRVDPRGEAPSGEPFEIDAQAFGVFSCRREVWPGANPRFRGYGGSEWYIHEKIRRQGGRCLCLPWFRWVHRLPRPSGVPYPRMKEDYLRNQIIGHVELGLELTPMLAHFAERHSIEWVTAIVTKTFEEEIGASPDPVLRDLADVRSRRDEYPNSQLL